MDPRGSVVRLAMAAAGWELRGGVVGPQAIWRRGADEHVTDALSFTGSSPIFGLAVARRLALEIGGTSRVRLVRIDDVVLATLVVDEQWTRSSATTYDVVDLATGERRMLDTVMSGLWNPT